MTNTPKKIAIIGAGPIGIETALRALSQGFDVQIYECSHIGAHIERWAHVTFFSPWALNHTPLGTATLAREFPADHYPTGREYLDNYLRPLARSAALQGKIYEHTHVLGISKKHALKGEFIGQPERARQPFVLLLQQNGRQFYTEADIVIDTSGNYANPNYLGPGGLPLPGTHILHHHIERYIPDIAGKERHNYANKHTLVVGNGYSAVTSLAALHQLQKTEPDTRITWIFRTPENPFEVIPDDSLPQRQHLTTFGNLASQDKVDGITPLPSTTLNNITLLSHHTQSTFQVEFTRNGPEQPLSQSLRVDKIISNIGYKPDTELYRELQVHLCYASEGPMKLAAALLASSGSSGSSDCLQQTSAGPETLKNPEPNFFILGSKSYGRGSAFLLKIGFEQIDDLFTHLLPQP